jgi:WD40 repeat protein
MTQCYAIVEKDHSIGVYESKTSKKWFLLTGHTQLITSMKQLTNGRLLSTSFDGTVRVWDVGLLTQTFQPSRAQSSHATIIRYHHPHMIRQWVELADGRLALALDKTICIWELTLLVLVDVFELKGHTRHITALTQLYDGRLVSGSADTTIRIWYINSGASFELKGHTQTIQKLLCPPNSPPHLISSSYDSTIRVWNVFDKTCIRILQVQSDPWILTLSMQDDSLYCEWMSGIIRAWNRTTWEETKEVPETKETKLDTFVELSDVVPEPSVWDAVYANNKIMRLPNDRVFIQRADGKCFVQEYGYLCDIIYVHPEELEQKQCCNFCGCLRCI